MTSSDQPPPAPAAAPAADDLLRLYEAILARRGMNPAESKTARLFAAGPKKIAKKVGEEAVEVALDAMNEDRQGVINESADLLYNLSVLWATLSIHPDDVFAEIRRREALYGIAEKLPKPPGGGSPGR
ncbi:phosphoribosyl-ATP pyrophosphohydrolase [Azospirillum agricola]|uniref:phosphoribosyl-ATP diphosphatase n=1 Tax=Azospirillum agricola TaxID=1720247 RepID=UPI001AEA4273|nr:phosphoribosyl-ATP diphosphatase [Azospirillum agricola]MBP2231342.1 phosphoribosyl-ATP pyrophosphohydrolase [Azospirillum agricola]